MKTDEKKDKILKMAEKFTNMENSFAKTMVVIGMTMYNEGIEEGKRITKQEEKPRKPPKQTV